MAQRSQKDTYKLKITSHLPVGWGEKYQAIILDVVEGSSVQFGDTIIFGRIDFTGEDYFTKGDIRTISFENTKIGLIIDMKIIDDRPIIFIII